MNIDEIDLTWLEIWCSERNSNLEEDNTILINKYVIGLKFQ